MEIDSGSWREGRREVIKSGSGEKVGWEELEKVGVGGGTE